MPNVTCDKTQRQYRQLIELLRDEGAMSLDEIAAAMNLSSDWARKHVRHMNLEGIATLSRTIKGDRTFRAWISGDQQRIDEFLAMIDSRVPTATQAAYRAKAREYKRKPKAVADLHVAGMVSDLMGELGTRARRLPTVVHVHRDDLVAALFGPAKTKKDEVTT